MRSPSQSVRAAGAELLTFGDEILFAFLCVHGAQHSWNRLKWLADLGALIASRNPNEIERLYRSAVELGAGRTPAVGLLLCRRLFAVPLAPRLLQLTRDRFTAFIETVALRAINDRRQASTGVLSRFREMCSHLLLAPGAAFMRAQARVLWNMPLERARFGAAPFGLTFHLLRDSALDRSAGETFERPHGWVVLSGGGRLMPRTARLRALSPSQRRVLAEAMLMLTLAFLAVALLPFERLPDLSLGTLLCRSHRGFANKP